MDIKYGLFEVLKNPEAALTPTERELADYVLMNPQYVLSMTIQELATHNNTSPSAVTRLCKKLDIADYRSFKIYLSQSLERQRIRDKRSLIESSPYGQFYQDIQNSLEETLDIVDQDNISAVNKLIHESEVVYVYGNGFSKEVADDIFKKWNVVGKSFVVIPDRDTGVIAVSNSKKKGIFIGLSNSGNSNDVTRVMDGAIRNGLPTVAITNYKASEMSQKADYTLYNGKGTKLPKFVSYSIYAQIFLVDVLYLDYVETYGPKEYKFKGLPTDTTFKK